MPLIETEVDGAIGTVRLDHTKNRNVLSKDMAAAIVGALERLRRIVCDSDDYAEGVRAFREKRAPKFSGH